MNEINSLVSIIVPCWNVEKYLRRCIESLLGQTYKQLEIILINDGSTDNTLEICLGYEKNNDCIKVISHANQGVSITRNIGLKSAMGSYVMFVDADDYVDANYVERMISVAHKNQAEVVICHGLDCHEDGTLLEGEEQYLGRSKEVKIVLDERYNFFKDYTHTTVWGVLFKKDIIRDLRFEKTLYVGEDTLFYIQAVLKSKAVYYIAEGMYHYIHYPSSAAHGKYTTKKLTEIRAWEKIVELLPVNTVIWESAKGQLMGRCIKILKSMDRLDEVDRKEYKRILDIARRNLKYALKYIPKNKTKISYLVFAISPKLYYRIKKVD